MRGGRGGITREGGKKPGQDFFTDIPTRSKIPSAEEEIAKMCVVKKGGKKYHPAARRAREGKEDAGIRKDKS